MKLKKWHNYPLIVITVIGIAATLLLAHLLYGALIHKALYSVHMEGAPPYDDYGNPR